MFVVCLGVWVCACVRGSVLVATDFDAIACQPPGKLLNPDQSGKRVDFKELQRKREEARRWFDENYWARFVTRGACEWMLCRWNNATLTWSAAVVPSHPADKPPQRHVMVAFCGAAPIALKRLLDAARRVGTPPGALSSVRAAPIAVALAVSACARLTAVAGRAPLPAHR